MPDIVLPVINVFVCVCILSLIGHVLMERLTEMRIFKPEKMTNILPRYFMWYVETVGIWLTILFFIFVICCLSFFLFFLIRNKNIFINRVKLKRMRNPSLITNLIKTKEKKKEKEDVKMSQHYYFNTFELHIEIQLSWIKLRGMPLKVIVVDAKMMNRNRFSPITFRMSSLCPQRSLHFLSKSK